MTGKTVVITGATSGIGQAAALALAKQGARIALVARDRAKAEATLALLKSANPSTVHKVYLGDLSTIAEMKRVGAEIAANEPRIDVLANNAGAIFTQRGETSDGLERTFAVNHMAYFVLTNALLDRLKATPGARIVSTASEAHQFGGPLVLDDLQMKTGYSTFGAYGRSKLANIYFTQELARRLAGSGVVANCLHPGFVASNFATNNGPLARIAMTLGSVFALPPEKGADTLVWLASAPEAATLNGGYYDRRKPGKLAAFASDQTVATQLWAASETLAA